MQYFKSIISSSLGNIIEWYDFGLFTIFSSLFSKLFFPTSDPSTSFIATISIFAIGFLCRPIGALIFGYLGDKHGRSSTLRLSILMITLPTLLLGFIPTYQTIGVFAPLCLLLVRMWQGISIGGEYSGNIVYLAENAPDKHRALFTSFASMGSNIGILLAAIIGIITTDFFSSEFLQHGGWRIPYILSGILSLIIYYFRLRIQESVVFNYLKKQHLIPKNPIKVLLSRDKIDILRTLGLVCMGTTFYYFTFVYVPMLLTKTSEYSLNSISSLMSMLLLLMTISTPIAAYICDLIGRKKMLLFNSFAILCVIVPGFYFLLIDKQLMILILLLFTLLSASEQSTTPIAIIENFPLPARYSGVALGYNLGNGFLGGTVPMVAAALVNFTHTFVAGAFYVALCALITFCVALFFVPETKNISLKFYE